jgi:hypothetical protein
MPLAASFRCARAAFRLLAVTLLAFQLFATAAHAGSILPNPVDVIGLSSTIARITLIGTTTGTPAGGVALAGSVAAGDETLLFTVAYLAEGLVPFAFVSLDRLNGEAWSGVGWIPGAAVDWSLGEASGSFASVYSHTLFVGATSDVFFVSASSFVVGETFRFSFVGNHGYPDGQETATWVPEPGTLALLACGLVYLSGAARRV